MQVQDNTSKAVLVFSRKAAWRYQPYKGATQSALMAVMMLVP
jgi:hypothetical protein